MESRLFYYPLNPKQHGFTKGLSTESAISNLLNYLESFVMHKLIAIAIFLDITSAYDSMDIDHIRTSLYLHGGDDDLVE